MTDPATTTETGRPLLGTDQRDELQRRWLHIEESFVDDPAAAVARADDLVDDAIDHIRAALAEHRTTLRGRWEALEDATTEQLRAALHHYERLFSQLSGFSAPSGWDDDARTGRPTAHGRPTFRPSEGSTDSTDSTDRASTSSTGSTPEGSSGRSSGSTSVDAASADATDRTEQTGTNRSDSEKGARS